MDLLRTEVLLLAEDAFARVALDLRDRKDYIESPFVSHAVSSAASDPPFKTAHAHWAAQWSRCACKCMCAKSIGKKCQLSLSLSINRGGGGGGLLT